MQAAGRGHGMAISSGKRPSVWTRIIENARQGAFRHWPHYKQFNNALTSPVFA
jgi:hypothetical protein